MRGPIELLQDAFEHFQKHAKLYVSIYAVSGVFMFLTSFFAPMPGKEAEMTDPLYFLLMLVYIVVSVFTTIALIKAVSEPETTTFESAYSFAKKGAISYIILSLIFGVVVIIGFILLVIPGLIALTWFGFCYFMLLFENKRGIEAMKASKRFVDGRFMPIFIRYVVLCLAMLVVAIFVAMIASIFNSVIVENLLMVLAYAVLSPVSIAYMYFMYLDVKKEGAYQPAPAAEPAALGATAAAPNDSVDAAPRVDGPSTDSVDSDNSSN